MVYQSFKEDKNTSFKKIIIGIIFFAFMAGNINASFLYLCSISISHITGNLTHLGEVIFFSSNLSFKLIGLVIFGFLAGAMLSGFFLGDAKYSAKKKYGMLMMIEGIILSLAGVSAEKYLLVTILLTSFAMGVQNSMVSSYQGMIIRTTHMTGVLTDFGFLIGSFLRRKKLDYQKLLFLLVLLISFFLGVCSGIYFAPKFRFSILYFWSIICLLLGMIYYQQRIKYWDHKS